MIQTYAKYSAVASPILGAQKCLSSYFSTLNIITKMIKSKIILFYYLKITNILNDILNISFESNNIIFNLCGI